jgi:hypothetical protein
MTPVRKLAARAVLALMAVHVGLAGSLALARSARHLLQAVHEIGEDPASVRRRVFGAGYVAAIEEIRRAIPPDGAYLLVDGQEREEGALYWVRFDLAPRRAHLLGRLEDLPSAADLRRRRMRDARFVVISYGRGRPPRLLRRSELIRSLEGPQR